jgi:NNP family nitrate/nitrite transporter-like MFS transporter
MNQARAISLFDFRSRPMRTFHMAWSAFFLCFFGWFGVAPLMAIIRDELHLTKAQVGNTIIASVSITILGRLLVGWSCDRVGPRRTYAGLLFGGALPVLFIGFAHDYTTFLLFRLAIGIIGSSFVITQYHTSIMFAPAVVGTANAMTAGWGNLGGGATQILMPLLFGVFAGAGVSRFWSWRLSMAVVGLAMLVAGVLYMKLTTDTPNGNFGASGVRRKARKEAGAAFRDACKDRRVWALFVLYGACFGMELTVDNVAALYFHDSFHLSLQSAGIVAGSFGMMNLFARALGGYASDRLAVRLGVRGRVWLLAGTIFLEGIALIAFSRLHLLWPAIAALLVTGLFLKMSNGATYAIVPFVRHSGLGAVAGIVGAGGNTAAMAAGFLFKSEHLTWSTALLICGALVSVASLCTIPLRSLAHETASHPAASPANMEETCRLADYEFSA